MLSPRAQTMESFATSQTMIRKCKVAILKVRYEGENATRQRTTCDNEKKCLQACKPSGLQT